MRTSTLRRVGTGAALAALLSVAACSGGGGGSGTAGKPTGASVADAGSVTALQQIRKKTGTVRSARIEGTTEMGDTVSMKQTGTIGGKRWVRYAYQDLAELGGPAGDVLEEQVQNSTPEQGLKALLAAGDVRKAGQDDVRGVPATRYSGTVDVAELTGRNSALDAGQLAALKERLTAAGVTTQTVDIWVGEDDLPLKKTERGETAAGAFSSTVFYSDHGTEVSVEKPSAADTVDFKEILRQRAAGPS
ncbi:hypothetical protein [Streptomyces cyaneofuscatus]